MSDNPKNGALGNTIGLLTMLASGPLLGGKLGEAEHTVCADCSRHEPARTLGPGYVNCTHANLVWRVEELENEPPWAGCRGFKLRDGAPGPLKRYAQAVRARTDAMLKEGRKP